MGLEAKIGSSSSGKNIVGREDGKIIVEEDVVGGKRGEKRKFELDEDELLRIAREERNKARKAIDDEKVCIFQLYLSFTLTPCVGIKDDTALLLGPVNNTFIKYQHDLAQDCQKSKAITCLSCLTRRQTPLLFSTHSYHARIYGGEGRNYRGKSTNMPFLQKGVEQYLQSDACKALRACSMQELCIQIHDSIRGT
jgi:hypothetical protein